MNLSYNKLVLVGNCQSGKRLITRILSKEYSDLIIESNIDKTKIEMSTKDSLYNYIKFIKTIVPKNKILLGVTDGVLIFNKLNYNITKKWKFIQIDREALSSISSWLCLTKHKNDYQNIIKWALLQEIKQNILYENIKHNALRINFNDVFYNKYETMNHIFKFIELKTPKKSIIDYYYDVDTITRLLKKNKCKIGDEINLLESEKNEVMEVFDYYKRSIKNEIILENVSG